MKRILILLALAAIAIGSCRCIDRFVEHGKRLIAHEQETTAQQADQ